MISKDTRTNIMDVAQDLIQRRGVNGMSFQDISDAVKIRKASIHHHFASKQDLVEALLVRYRAEFGVLLTEILDSRAKAKGKLLRYGALFEGTLQAGNQDKSCLCGMLAAEVFSLDDGPVHSVKGFMQDNVKFLTKVLKEGKKDGSLAIRGNVEDSASMILAAFEGGLLVARADGGPEQLSAIIRNLVSLLTARP